MVDKKLLFTIVLIFIYILGVITTLATNYTGRILWQRLIGVIRIKLKPHHNKVVNSLSDDTQIVLKQYMQQAYHYGETVYIVRNVKMFDFLLNNHINLIKNKVYNNRAKNLEECINDELKEGKGFVIILNGDEYVAIPSPVFIDTNNLVK